MYLILIAFFYLCSDCYADLTNCNTGSLVKQQSVSLVNKVSRGADVRLNMTLISPYKIDDAKATYYTRYNYLPIYRYTEDVGPIEFGLSRRSFVYPIPAYAVGNIKVEIVWNSATYGDLLCLVVEKNL
jgi:hypothetical protein